MTRAVTRSRLARLSALNPLRLSLSFALARPLAGDVKRVSVPFRLTLTEPGS